MKLGEVNSNEDDLPIVECFTLHYQPREGVPGFEVETKYELLGHPLPTELEIALKLSIFMTIFVSSCR